MDSQKRKKCRVGTSVHLALHWKVHFYWLKVYVYMKTKIL